MNFNLKEDVASIIRRLIVTDPFYGLFISSIEKIESTKIPLAAVSLNTNTFEFSLIINPEEWNKYSNEVKYGVIKHEALHLVLFHLINSSSYSNSKMDNYACDIEVNQYISKELLPEWVVTIDKMRKEYPKLNWEYKKGRNYYYKLLDSLSDKEKEKLNIDNRSKHIWEIVDNKGNPIDLDSLSESEVNSIRTQIENTIEELAKEIQKNQGNIPHEISSIISGFKKPKPVYNYKKYIRNFVGNSNKYTIKSSKIRENQRFEGANKIILTPKNKILVLIDQSGSVQEDELYEVLNEIAHLSKINDIEIRAFDTVVYKPTKYKAGSNNFTRTACGGTSFTAAIDFYNSSTYSTCLIFTDGHAEVPPVCNKNLLWIITSSGVIDSIKNHARYLKINKN